MSIKIGDNSSYDNDIDTVRFLIYSKEEDILDYYIKGIKSYWNVDSKPTNTLDVLKICGDLLCNKSTEEMLFTYKSVENKINIRLLFNRVGHFSFNSYMYGLFNGIYLVGIPDNNECTYDGITTNGVDFIAHDIAHSWGMSFMDTNLLRDLETKYYKVIRGEYNKEQKEHMSLGVFILVHEYDTPLDIICDYDKLYNYIELEEEKHNIDANECMGLISYKSVLHTCNDLLNK